MRNYLIAFLSIALLFGCIVSEKSSDLGISSIVYDNIAKSLTIRVMNSGNAPAAGFFVEAYDGEKLLGGKQSMGLGENGKSSLVIENISLSDGTHAIKAVADPENLIKESDETNNSLEETINASSEQGQENVAAPEQEYEEGTLSSIMQRGLSQQNVHLTEESVWETLSTGAKSNYSSEVWAKGSTIKMHGRNIPLFGELVVVQKGAIAYVSYPSIPEGQRGHGTWAAMYLSYSKPEGVMVSMTPDNYYNTLLEIEDAQQIKVIGKEKLGTRSTVIVEYLTKPSLPNFPNTAKTKKAWIWVEKGIPLKRENLSEITKVTSTVSQIDFEPVDESLFAIDGNIDESNLQPYDIFTVMAYKFAKSQENGNEIYKQVNLDGTKVKIEGTDNSNSWNCTTDSNGSCSIDSFKKGKYSITASKEGCEEQKEDYDATVAYGMIGIALNC